MEQWPLIIQKLHASSFSLSTSNLVLHFMDKAWNEGSVCPLWLNITNVNALLQHLLWPLKPSWLLFGPGNAQQGSFQFAKHPASCPGGQEFSWLCSNVFHKPDTIQVGLPAVFNLGGTMWQYVWYCIFSALIYIYTYEKHTYIAYILLCIFTSTISSISTLAYAVAFKKLLCEFIRVLRGRPIAQVN